MINRSTEDEGNQVSHCQGGEVPLWKGGERAESGDISVNSWFLKYMFIYECVRERI